MARVSHDSVKSEAGGWLGWGESSRVDLWSHSFHPAWRALLMSRTSRHSSARQLLQSRHYLANPVTLSCQKKKAPGYLFPLLPLSCQIVTLGSSFVAARCHTLHREENIPSSLHTDCAPLRTMNRTTLPLSPIQIFFHIKCFVIERENIKHT